MIENEEFVQDFVDEAKAHLDTIESSFLRPELSQSDPELVNVIFRAIHSIKGTASFFGLKSIVTLSHAMENVFGEIRAGRMKISSAILDELLLCNDCLKNMVDNVLESENVEVSPYVESLNNAVAEENSAKEQGGTKKTAKNITKADDSVKEDGSVKEEGTTLDVYGIIESNIGVVEENVKFGHKIYLVSASIFPIKKYVEELCGKFESVGTVLYTDAYDSTAFEGKPNNTPVAFTFLLTSVLDKELLSMGVDVPAKNIQTLTLKQQTKVDAKQVVSEITEQTYEEPISEEQKFEDGISQADDIDIYEIIENNKNIVEENVRFGHKVYLLEATIIPNKKEVDELCEKVESVGAVLYSNAKDSKKASKLSADTPYTFYFLITSVLTVEFLSMGADIPESSIKQIQLKESIKRANDENDDIVKRAKAVFSESKLSKEDEEKEIKKEVEKEIKTEVKKEVKKEINEEIKLPLLPKVEGLELPLIASVEVGQQQNTPQQTQVASRKPRHVDDSLRVNVSVLNDLIDMSSELILGRNQLLATLENYRKHIPGLQTILQNIDRLSSSMQEKIMQTRMQPLSNVFNRFPRVIHDLSKLLNKEIDLHITGDDVELDKTVIEGLSDPLTHLVRNAADHGIETPEVREIKGKPRVGTISIKAYHDGGYVHIDVTDDGAGLNPHKLKKKAVEKGILTEAEVEALTEKEVLQLILRPGFSTASQITDISGRGVGMDVVKTNIEKLGGTIEIHSHANHGSTMRLLLPLTLAIVQSLIVETEGVRFVLPQINLKEIVRVYGEGNNEIHKIEFIHDIEVLRLRNKLLPIIRLADILGMQQNHCEFPQKKMRVLVLKIGMRTFGLLVDDILGREEILVKPLPRHLGNCIFYSGVTIMGDGKTSMILDPAGILSYSLHNHIDDEEVEEEEVDDKGFSAEMQNLIMFKCSGEETFAIDMNMVSRVQEIKRSSIERIGDKEFIKLNGSALRIIRPEDYLPVTKASYTKEKLYVLIPKLVRHPIGVLIDKILDNLNTKLKLNSEDIRTEGVVGTIVHNDRILTIVNLYEVFEKADPSHFTKRLKHIGIGRSILLAEDTPFFQKVIARYLESVGYNVTVVPDGARALEELAEHEFDALVSDIQMPHIDGLELVRRVRSDPKLANLPAIAVTSMSNKASVESGYESGFDFYELKLDREKLAVTIEKAIKKRKRRSVNENSKL